MSRTAKENRGKPAPTEKVYAVIYITEDFETKGDILDVDGVWTEYDNQMCHYPTTTKIEIFTTDEDSLLGFGVEHNIAVEHLADEKMMTGYGIEPDRYKKYRAIHPSREYKITITEYEIVELDTEGELDWSVSPTQWGWTDYHRMLAQVAERLLENGKSLGGERRMFLPYNTFEMEGEED